MFAELPIETSNIVIKWGQTDGWRESSANIHHHHKQRTETTHVSTDVKVIHKTATVHDDRASTFQLNTLHVRTIVYANNTFVIPTEILIQNISMMAGGSLTRRRLVRPPGQKQYVCCCLHCITFSALHLRRRGAHARCGSRCVYGKNTTVWRAQKQCVG